MAIEMDGTDPRWISKKESLISKLETAKSDCKVDTLALALIDTINNHPDYCTSSSCSGRTMLLEIKKSKKDAYMYWKQHDVWVRGELKKSIYDYSGKKNLWLFCQGFIFHVYCHDVFSANKLLSALRKFGLKRAGIISFAAFPVIEFMSNNYVAVPVIFQSKNGPVYLHTDEGLSYIESVCIEKMNDNKSQLLKLTQFLKTFILNKE